MELVKLSSKFQITLPRKVRAELKVKAGDRIVFVKKCEQFLSELLHKMY